MNHSKIKLLTNLKEKYEIEIDEVVLGKELRNENVATKASEIAKVPEIRNAIIKFKEMLTMLKAVSLQMVEIWVRLFFLEAILQVFLQASPEVRAERRANQLKEKGMDVIMHDLLKLIEQRDKEDMNRKVSPLKPAQDSILIDTSELSIQEEVEEKVMENYKKL